MNSHHSATISNSIFPTARYLLHCKMGHLCLLWLSFASFHLQSLWSPLDQYSRQLIAGLQWLLLQSAGHKYNTCTKAVSDSILSVILINISSVIINVCTAVYSPDNSGILYRQHEFWSPVLLCLNYRTEYYASPIKNITFLVLWHMLKRCV